MEKQEIEITKEIKELMEAYSVDHVSELLLKISGHNMVLVTVLNGIHKTTDRWACKQ